MLTAHYSSTALTQRLCATIVAILLGLSLWMPKSSFAMRVALIPFKARHLSRGQKLKQVRLLTKELKALGGVSVEGVEGAERFVRRRRLPLSSLERLNQDKALILELCERLQVDVLLFPEMKLGTERRPAKLISRMLGCKRGGQVTHSVSFSGRLSRSLWRDVAQSIDGKLMRLVSKESAPPQTLAPSQELLSPAPLARPPSIAPPPHESSAPPATLKPSAEQALKPMVSHEARDPWAGRLSLWAEGRMMNRSFELVTSNRTVSLKGGITYTSRWIMGYGLTSRLVLSDHFALEGDFAEYQFESTQIIYNLFDDSNSITLKSLQRVGGLGATFSQIFSASGRQHRAGVRLGWYMSQHLIEPNNDYQGFTAHGADLQAFGLLALTEKNTWLDLRGKLIPLVGLGTSVKELGGSAESLGFGFSLSLIYRSESGVGTKLGVSFDELVHSPTGSGRGNRIGLEAVDQLYQITLAVGWLGPK